MLCSSFSFFCFLRERKGGGVDVYLNDIMTLNSHMQGTRLVLVDCDVNWTIGFRSFTFSLTQVYKCIYSCRLFQRALSIFGPLEVSNSSVFPSLLSIEIAFSQFLSPVFVCLLSLSAMHWKALPTQEPTNSCLCSKNTNCSWYGHRGEKDTADMYFFSFRWLCLCSFLFLASIL